MKASNAAQYGVAATIVYNNVPGTISMDLSSYWNEAPCVLVTQDTARVFRDKAEPVYDKNDSSKVLYYKGRMKVSADAAVIPDWQDADLWHGASGSAGWEPSCELF